MSLEQRFYTSPLVERVTRAGTVMVPSISLDPVLGEYGHRFVSRTGDDPDEFIFLFEAPVEVWDAFDAAYPNQDAQDGDPYRRRYPRSDVPSLNG